MHSRIVWRDAGNYLRAADLILEDARIRAATSWPANTLAPMPEDQVLPSMPAYHNLCTALELVLKAFLLAHGVSWSHLASPRRYGHDLTKLLAAATKKGLTVNGDARVAAEHVNPYHLKRWFVYSEFEGDDPKWQWMPKVREPQLRAIVARLIGETDELHRRT